MWILNASNNVSISIRGGTLIFNWIHDYFFCAREVPCKENYSSSSAAALGLKNIPLYSRKKMKGTRKAVATNHHPSLKKPLEVPLGKPGLIKNPPATAIRKYYLERCRAFLNVPKRKRRWILGKARNNLSKIIYRNWSMKIDRWT